MATREDVLKKLREQQNSGFSNSIQRRKNVSSGGSVTTTGAREKYYSGSAPTARETRARIYEIASEDRNKAGQLWQQYKAFEQDKSTPLYNPYTQATSKAVREFGMDPSKGIDDSFFDSFGQLKNSYRYTETGKSPAAPTKSSTAEQNAAYWFYQGMQDEETTKKAESEWDALQRELAYWAGRSDRNLSDQEILRNVDMSKYPTLQRMDEGRLQGNPISLNRPVGYSEDAMYGVMWAARNPDMSTGDAVNDAALGVLGQGKQYQRNASIHVRLDPTSDKYNPYSVGSTVDDAAAYFGVSSFDDEWLENNRHFLNSGSEEDAKMWREVYDANETTKKMEAEYAQLIRSVYESEFARPEDVLDGLWDNCPTLRSADQGLEIGKPVKITRAINYRKQDVESLARLLCSRKSEQPKGDSYVAIVGKNLGATIPASQSEQSVSDAREKNVQSAMPSVNKVGTEEEKAVFRYSDVGNMAMKVRDSIFRANMDRATTYVQEHANKYAAQNYMAARDTEERFLEAQRNLEEAERQLEEAAALENVKIPENVAAFKAKWFPEMGRETPDMDDVIAVAENLTEAEQDELWDDYYADGLAYDLFDLSTELEASPVLSAEKTVAEMTKAVDELRPEYESAMKKMKRIAENLDIGNRLLALSGSTAPALTTSAMEYARGFTEYEPANWDIMSVYNDAIDSNFSKSEISAAALQSNQAIDAEIAMLDNALSALGDHDVQSEKDYAAGMIRRKETLERQKKGNEYFLVSNAADFERIASETLKNIESSWTGAKIHGLQDVESEYFTASSIAEAIGGSKSDVNSIQLLSKNEQNTLLYLYGTKGEQAAKEYLEFMQDNSLMVRNAEEWEAFAKNAVASNPLAAVGMNALSVIASGMQSLGSVYSIAAGVSGNEINPYSTVFNVNRVVASTREQTKDELSQLAGDKEWLNTVFTGAYDVLMGSADNLSALLLGGGTAAGSLFLQSGGAASSSVMEAKMRGATDAQAMALGAATMMAEAATEAGPIGKAIEAFGSGVAGNVKGALKEVVASVVSEGIGEGLSEAIGQVSDDFVMQELSKREEMIAKYESDVSREEAEELAAKQMVRNIIYAAIIGSLSGGVTSGAFAVAGYANKKSQGTPSVDSERGVNAPAAQAENANVGVAEAKESGNEAEKKGTVDGDVSALTSAMETEDAKSQTATMSAVLMTDDVSGDAANAAAVHLSAIHTPTEAVAALRRTLLTAAESGIPSEKVKSAVITAALGNGEAAAAMENAVESTSRENVEALVEAAERDTQNAEVASRVDNAVLENEISARVQELVADGGMSGTDSYKVAAAHARVNLEAAQTNYEKAVAKSEAAGKNFQVLYDEYLANPGDMATRGAMQQALSDVEGQHVVVGQMEQSVRNNEAQLREAQKKLDDVTRDTMMHLREQAQQEVLEKRQREALAKQEADAAEAAVQETNRQRENVTSVDAETFIEENYSGLSEEEKQTVRERYAELADKEVPDDFKSGVELMTRLSKKFGFSVKIVEGDGVAEGAYDRDSNTIVITKSISQSEALKRVFLHEMTHFAENSKKKYDAFQKAVFNLEYGNDTARMNADIAAVIAAYNDYYQKNGIDKQMDETGAKKELAAKINEKILEGDQDLINRLCEEEPSAAQEIWQKIKNLINKLRGVNDPEIDKIKEVERLFERALNKSKNTSAGNGVQLSIKRGDDNEQYVDIESDILAEVPKEQWPSGVQKNIAEKFKNGIAQPERVVNTQIESSENKEPLVGDLRGTAVQESLRSWTSVERETVRKNLLKKFPEEDVDKWIADVDSVARYIAADRDRLDFEATDNQVMLKPNQEYVKTLDASTLCAKRLLYQGTFNAIQHEMPDSVITSDGLIKLRNMMAEMGYETPCGICYVESRRRNLGKFAQEWLDGYDSQGGYKPKLADVTTTDGLENMRINHPEVYESFTSKMNKKGSNNPKVVQLRTDYRGDIRSMTRKQVDRVVEIGGLRVQSFSDFETPHLLDVMQAVLDMSEKGLTSQAYTKVPNFAAVFGGTGVKINLSLIGDGNGLNPDGSLKFSSYEGMDFDKAVELRNMYPENVGTILVGINDEHIKAAMADPRIDFIIPFHKSGWGQKQLEQLTAMRGYTDYTSNQNEKRVVGVTKSGKKTYKNVTDNFHPVDYWDYTKSGKENAETYLRMCAEDGRIPKFPQFLQNSGDGSYSLPSDGSADGYWKLLIDFKMYDNDGVGAPQRAVTPDFNMEEAVRVLKEYEGGADNLPVAQDVVDRYVKEYKQTGGTFQFSLPTPNVLDQQIRSYQNGRKVSDDLTGQEASPELGERQFATQTAQKSQVMPDWLKREMLTNADLRYYEKDTNKGQLARSWDRFQREGYDTMRTRLMENENPPTADDIADANMVMAFAFRFDDPETAFGLSAKYDKEGTVQGQALQARKLFSKMTPAGARRFVSGKMENQLNDYIESHAQVKKEVDKAAQEVSDRVKGKQGGDEIRRIYESTEYTIDSRNNRLGILLNEQQAALIHEYGLENVARPGVFYNRATVKQRMLEAIIATKNPLALTGNGLTLVQRLEYMKRGVAVITNADVQYLGSQMAFFAASDIDTQNGREGSLALARAYEAFGNIKTATLSDKARTWRYTSMLLSIPSATRNVMGNAGQNVLNAASHGVAVAIDKAVAKRTKKRTRESLNAKDRIEGWKEFKEETINTYKDFFVDKAVTERGERRFDTHKQGRIYQNSVMEGMRNAEQFLMSFGDRNVWKKAYANSMAEQQHLADINGVELDYATAREQAEADANYATFTESNALAGMLANVKRGKYGWVVDFLMPFTGVPSNIAVRMWQYSPMGLVQKLAVEPMINHFQKKNFDQKSFVDGVARGLTGSAAVALGIALGQLGMIKLGYGSEEKDKKALLETAQGDQYSPFVQIGEYTFNLSPFSPAVAPIIMGAEAAERFKEDPDVLNALYSGCIASLGQIFDSSFLSNIQNIFGYGDPVENAARELLKSFGTQNIPSMIGQLADALDPYTRDTKDKNMILQALKEIANKIPGARNMLPEKVDVAGRSVESKSTAGAFLNPFTTTRTKDDPVLNELERLYNVMLEIDEGKATSHLPNDALSGRKDELTGVEGRVTGRNKEWYKKRYGELWREGGITYTKEGKKIDIVGLAELINSNRYHLMTDEEKAKAIEKVMKQAKEGATWEIGEKLGHKKK